MTRVVTGRDVWPAITTVLGGAGPRRCAVAFLGADASDMLGDLRRGDLVICDASPHALKSGATNPAALRALVDRKVTVRSRPRLHAKIYLSVAGAFVGSANASATAVGNDEAGVVLTGAKALAELVAYIDGLATAQETTRVDDSFIELAQKLYRPPAGGKGAAQQAAPGRALWFYAYGEEPPKAVAKAAETQRAAWRGPAEDASATLDYSWGPAGAWTKGAMCVWVERGRAEDPSTWLAEPPAICVHREPVGGSSKQWIYWWRTPAAAGVTFGALRRHVLTHAGVSVTLDRSTRVHAALDATFDAFGLTRSGAAGGTQIV